MRIAASDGRGLELRPMGGERAGAVTGRELAAGGPSIGSGRTRGARSRSPPELGAAKRCTILGITNVQGEVPRGGPASSFFDERMTRATAIMIRALHHAAALVAPRFECRQGSVYVQGTAMENEAIAVQILETTQRIDRCLRSEAPGLRSRRVEPPHLLLEDLHACLNWLCDELEGKRDAPGSARSEPVLPKVAGGFLELIEGLDAVFWLADVETSRLLYVSRGCAAIWGRSAAELREQPHLLEEGIHPEDRERLLRGNEAGLRRGTSRDESSRILRPDGLVRHARIRTLPLMDRRGGCGRVAGIAEDITAREEAEEQVRKDRAELRALASELVLTEERERRKLATDLHDGSQQALELARIKLGVLLHADAGRDVGSALKEIGALLEQSLEALGSLTFELSPPVLHDLGLVPALQWLAEDLERRLDLQVVVDDDGRAKPLDDRIRVLLFRSTRELLLNVAKHARIDRALVSLRREGQTLVLAVIDEGTGFDPEKLRSASQGGGYGLFSIRQRLEHLDGLMQCRSARRRRTAVVLSAQLQQESTVGEGRS